MAIRTYYTKAGLIFFLVVSAVDLLLGIVGIMPGTGPLTSTRQEWY